MPDTGHYFIDLTCHAFSDLICDWLGNVSKIYMLHSQPLQSSFVSFDFFNPLAVVHESSEKQDSFTVKKANDKCVNDCDQDVAQYLRMILAENSDDSERIELYFWQT